MAWSATTIAIVALVLAGCAGSAGQSGDTGNPESPGKYTVVPLARLVLPRDHDLRDAVTRIQNDSLTFDERYRQPDLPQDRVPVRCDITDRIGIAFDLRRRNKYAGRNVRVRDTWTHGAVRIADETLDQTRRVGMEAGRGSKLMIATLTLTPQLRIDGVWSMSVSIDGEVLFRDSFELTGCDDISQ